MSARIELIFDLISQMHPTEKRDFKRFSMRKSTAKIPIYVQLFNVIERKGALSDKDYQKDLSLTKTNSRFDNTKSQLYKNIIKSLFLTSLRREEIQNLSIKQFELQLLHKRGLYKHCNDRLKNLKKKERLNESWTTILDCLDVQVLLGEYSNPELLAIQNERKLASENYHLELEFQSLFEAMESQYKRLGLPRNYSDLEYYENIHKDNLIRSDTSATTVVCKMYRLFILNHYSHVNHDEEKAIEYSLSLVKLFDKHSYLGSRYPQLFLQSKLNLVVNYLTFNEVETARVLQFEFENELLQSKNSELKLEFLLRNKLAGFRIQIADQKFAAIYNVRNEIDELLNQLKNSSVEYWYELYYLLAYSCFVEQDFRSAAVYLNKILNQTFRSLQLEIELHSRLLLLLTYFEQEEDLLIESQLRNSFTFLLKQKGLRKFERSILGIIRKAAKISLADKKAVREMFSDGQQRLNRVFNDPFEQGALRYFNYTAYFESKLKRKPFMRLS